MEQRLLDFFRGYVRIRITGSSRDRFLNLCAHRGIRLWCLMAVEDGFEACISKTDFFV